MHSAPVPGLNDLHRRTTSELSQLLAFTDQQPDLRGLLAGCTGATQATAGFYRRASRNFATQTLNDFVGDCWATGRSLRSQGLATGDVAIIAANATDAALRGFLASIAIGAIPVLLAARPAFDDPTSALDRLDQVLAGLPGTPTVVVAEGAEAPSAVIGHRLARLPNNLDEFGRNVIELPPAAPTDVAYLQLSSGSTGVPRPIAVTHGAAVAQIESLVDRTETSGDDVFCTWLPIYHDLGLVAFVLSPLGLRASFNLMTPFDFLGDPSAWIRALSETRATTTASPNFGIRHAVDRARENRLSGVDLSSLKRLCCGAEPISAETLRDFLARFEPHGLRDDVLVPCYGMAETTLMLTMAVHRRPVTTNIVPRSSLLELASVTEASAGSLASSPSLGNDEVEVVGVGPAGRGTDIWIEGTDGRPITDDLVCGEIVTRSSSLTAGYLRRDGSIEPLDADGFHTGDVGFLDRGELFVVERLKNTIIRHGQNISATAIEELLAEITGESSDAIVVIDSDLNEGLGRVTALIELPRKGDAGPILQCVTNALDRFRPALDDVVVVRPGGLPRTTSGKKRHHESRRLLVEGELAIVHHESLTPSVEVPGDSTTPDVVDLVAIETHAAIHATVAEVVRRKNPDAVVDESATFIVDLGFDSLLLYELAMALEDALDIELHEDDIADIVTVSDLTLLCTERRRAPSGITNSSITASIEAAARPVPQLLQVAEAQKNRQIQIEGRWVTDFASCNYLGFDLHPDVINAIDPAVREWGVHPSWTRVVASPSPYRTLEERLAELVGVPDTVVFPALTLLHMGVLPELATPGGTIFIDKAAHNSLRQAADLARSHGTTVVPFDHSDLTGLEAHFERSTQSPRVIVVDGVYSMSGSPAPLRSLVALAERHDATVYVDDAHGFGILGENPTATAPYGHQGNGVVRYLGLGYDRIIYCAGLSKAYSSMGAFVAARTPEERRLFDSAATMMFSGPVPTASLASALAGLQVNRTQGDAIRARLHSLSERLIHGVRSLGLEGDNGHGLPIVNIMIGSVEAAKLAAEVLWENALLVTPSLFPAVPLNQSGLRFTVTAANTIDEIDHAIAALALVRDRLGAGILS